MFLLDFYKQCSKYTYLGFKPEENEQNLNAIIDYLAKEKIFPIK